MSDRQPTPPAVITVIGTGVVGLTTAAGLALVGHRVIVMDLDAARIEALANGALMIDEPGLASALADGVGAGRLTFSTDGPSSVRASEIVFLCMPTADESTARVDAMQLPVVAARLGCWLRAGAVVVDRTSTGVGSAQQIEMELARDDVHVAVNPDFARVGSALSDFLRPDRVVVGAAQREVGHRVAALYDPLQAQVVVCGTAAAETIRFASTAFAATKVALVNSISELCTAVDADTAEVLAGVGLDRRVGEHGLEANAGFGSGDGDQAKALLTLGRSVGLELPIVDAAIRSNAAHMAWVADRVSQFIGRPLSGLRIAVWGLQPGGSALNPVDTAALHVVQMLRSRGATVAAHVSADATSAGDRSLTGIERCDDPYEPCRGAAVLVILGAQPSDDAVDLGRVAGLLDRPQVFDARHVLDPERAAAAGLSMAAVGR